MKIKNDKGEEIEVFTSEEVEEQKKEAVESAVETARTEAVEEYKKENPDKSDEISDLQNKLKEAEEKLAESEEDDGDDEHGKDPQVRRLRKERDEAKKALEDLTGNLDTKIDEKLNKIVGDTKEELLDQLSGDDDDLRKKIEFEFDNYRTGANSKKDIKERMEKAYQLATGEQAEPGVFDVGGAGAGDRGTGDHGTDPNEAKYNDNEIAIGHQFNITDDDRTNYEKFQKDQKVRQQRGLIPPGEVRDPKKQ